MEQKRNRKGEWSGGLEHLQCWCLVLAKEGGIWPSFSGAGWDILSCWCLIKKTEDSWESWQTVLYLYPSLFTYGALLIDSCQ